MGQLEESNKELARTFLDALSRADAGAIADLYAEDFQLWVTGSLPFSGTKGRAEALEGIPAVLGLFPDGLTFTIEALTAEGERVAIEQISKGAARASAALSGAGAELGHSGGGRLRGYDERGGRQDHVHGREYGGRDWGSM